jgi:hypothetical protein
MELHLKFVGGGSLSRKKISTSILNGQLNSSIGVPGANVSALSFGFKLFMTHSVLQNRNDLPSCFGHFEKRPKHQSRSFD